MTPVILRSKKGISLVECMIAVFLTVIAVVALMNMQPLSMQTASRSDYLGRAAGILQRELEIRENQFMSADSAQAGTVYDLGNPPTIEQTIVSGNVNFTVWTNISQSGANTKLINVRVTWPGTAVGIASSILVTRQFLF